MIRRTAPLIVLLLAAARLGAAALPQNPFASRPEKEHALLSQVTGTWKTTFHLSIPGAPPIESHGTEVNEKLGELWVVGRYDDPGMGGQRFAGVQIFGYDPVKKKYVAAWADSESSSLSLQEGTFDATTRTLTLSGPSIDPMTHKESTSRSVMQWTDDDHRVQKLYAPGPGGKEMEIFTIEYERAK